jgi:hypothetical protein
MRISLPGSNETPTATATPMTQICVLPLSVPKRDQLVGARAELERRVEWHEYCNVASATLDQCNWSSSIPPFPFVCPVCHLL